MSQILLEELDRTLDEAFDHLSKEETEMLHRRLELIRAQARFEPIETCINRFVQAETDCTTPGERGIGRVTLAPPRLGGYFRKQFARLSQRELVELTELIRSLVFRGYVLDILLTTEYKQASGSVESGRLFDDWITRIYVADFSTNNKRTILSFSYPQYDRLKQFLKSKGAVGGGMFSKDKTDEILFPYLMAGALLHRRELILTGPNQ